MAISTIIRLFAILLAGAQCEGWNEVDFVIVGGGTAGCVLAGRLCAALPDAKITLIERGAPRNEETEFLVRAPRNTLNTWAMPSLAEAYQSRPEPGLFGRTETIITGNTLGGSSSINGMQWMVPVSPTINRWRISGLSSTNWRRYLRRAFNKVGFGEPPEDLQQIYTADYLEAANRSGIPEDRRPLASDGRNGIWVNRLASTANGRRRDSCTSYVNPVLETTCSENLRVLQSSTVTRILLNKANPPRAYGVEYVVSTGNRTETREIRARKEVLITAGPYESPKLLQLSGIGPRRVLRRAGVKVRVNLGVGTRTQARVRTNLVSLYTGVPEEPSTIPTLLNSPESLRQWAAGDGGVLGVAVSFANGVLRRSAYFTGTFQRTEIGPGGIPVLVSVCLPNPSSFGSLQIKDSNPFSTPSVDLRILRKRSDLRRLGSCMRRMIKIHSQFMPPFQLTQIVPSTSPLSSGLLRNISSFGLHYVGGCAVGSVVRRNLMVKGVEGLRVIDASVFRRIPLSAGPLAATYMLAEFMAERLAQIYA